MREPSKAGLPDGKDVSTELSVQGYEDTKVAIRAGLSPDRTAAENLQRMLARRVNVSLSLQVSCKRRNGENWGRFSVVQTPSTS